MARLILLNKPFQVLSQFSDREREGAEHDGERRQTLADYLRAPGFKAAGRLDYDSEGLLLLTNDGRLQQQIANPASKTWKTYWVQVEGVPDEAALQCLRAGIELKDGLTRPAKARLIDEPEGLWPRHPPIRQRRDLADQWLEIKIREGRNRQVRRMTAAVGYPTLRLVRAAIADWTLEGLACGQWRQLDVHMPRKR